MPNNSHTRRIELSDRLPHGSQNGISGPVFVLKKNAKLLDDLPTFPVNCPLHCGPWRPMAHQGKGANPGYPKRSWRQSGLVS